MKARSSYCIIALFITLFTSCKKDKDANVPQQQNCRIITVAYGADYYSFAYDDKGRVTKKTESSQTGNYDTYTYTDNGYEMQTTKNNKLHKKTTAQLNVKGWVEKTTILEYSSNGAIVTGTTVNTYEYNSEGEMIKSITKIGNNPEQTTTYTWSNGNLAGDSKGYTYTYYTDKPGQDGNFLGVIDLINSDITKKQSKNLLKSLSIQGNTASISYEFDSSGKIILLKYNNGFIVLEHACH